MILNLSDCGLLSAMVSQVVVVGQVNKEAEVLRTMGVRRVSLAGEFDPFGQRMKLAIC